MAAKSENIFVKAKAYQKQHPRTTWRDCIKKVSGKKKNAPVKKVAAKKVGTVMRKKPVIVIKKKTGSMGAIGSIKRAEKIVRDINRLEAKRKTLKHKELKDIVQLEINNKHDQLKSIKAACRRRSA